MQKNVTSAQFESVKFGPLYRQSIGVGSVGSTDFIGSANFIGGHRRPKRMHGGTLAGVVLGLLVGLVVALGVALYITKAPMPFVDQAVRKSEAEVGKLAASAVKQAMPLSGIQNGAAPFTGGGQLPPDPNVVLLPKEAREFIATANASGKTGTQEAEKSPASTSVVFFLETGKFRENEEAEQMRVRLMLVGIEANVVEVVGDSAAPHRVRVGPFTSADEAYRARARVTENGFEAKLVKLGHS